MQHAIGVKHVFRGWVASNYINVNNHPTHVMKQANKIIVRKSAEFYSKAWTNRNKCFHNKEKHRSHVVEWHKRIAKNINEGNRVEMKRYLRSQRIDVERCDSLHIRLWNISTLNIMKRTKD